MPKRKKDSLPEGCRKKWAKYRILWMKHNRRWRLRRGRNFGNFEKLLPQKDDKGRQIAIANGMNPLNQWRKPRRLSADHGLERHGVLHGRSLQDIQRKYGDSMSTTAWTKSTPPWFHLLYRPSDTCDWLWAIANDKQAQDRGPAHSRPQRRARAPILRRAAARRSFRIISAKLGCPARLPV